MNLHEAQSRQCFDCEIQLSAFSRLRFPLESMQIHCRFYIISFITILFLANGR